MAREFTCAKCRETFTIDNEWTDADALAEAVESFGPIEHNAPYDSVCDDCYEQLLRWWKGRARN